MNRTASVLCLLLLSAPAIAQESAPFFRQQVPVPLLLGGRDDVADPLTLAFGGAPEFAVTGDNLDIALSIDGGNPPYEARLEGVSVPPLVSASTSKVGGTLTSGSFEFHVVVTDSSVPELSATSTPAWRIDVADPVVVGSVQTILATPGVTVTADLPAVAGGTGPFTYVITPAGQGVEVVGGRIEVLRSTVGVSTFQIAVTDNRGRTAPARSFDVDVAVPAPVASDIYLASATGGSLVKGASSVIHATSLGKPQTLHTRPSVRLSAGNVVSIAYDRVISATKLQLTYTGATTLSCSNSTPSFQFIVGQPRWTIRTSEDGTNWHEHADKSINSSSIGCGIQNHKSALDAGFTTFRYLTFTLDSALGRSSTQIQADFSELRPVN